MSIVPFLNRVNAVIINPLLTVLFALLMVYFIISIIKVIKADAKDKEKASNNMLSTIVGIFIIMSVYGLINFVLASFDIPKPTYLQNKL
jgi:uncharacterized membrane protein